MICFGRLLWLKSLNVSDQFRDNSDSLSFDNFSPFAPHELSGSCSSFQRHHNLLFRNLVQDFRISQLHALLIFSGRDFV